MAARQWNDPRLRDDDDLARRVRRIDALALDVVMRRAAMVMAPLAIVLMIAGFFELLIADPSMLHFPGPATVRLDRLAEVFARRPGISLMSAGILVLALVPLIRVFVAAWMYLRQRARTDALVALAVFVILLVSMLGWGG